MCVGAESVAGTAATRLPAQVRSNMTFTGVECWASHKPKRCNSVRAIDAYVQHAGVLGSVADSAGVVMVRDVWALAYGRLVTPPPPPPPPSPCPSFVSPTGLSSMGAFGWRKAC